MTIPTFSGRGRGGGGFTLIEVLIAMVILSVGLLALEGVAVNAARATATAARRSRYTQVATDTLERTLGRLREGQGNLATRSSSFKLRDGSGAEIATVRISIADGGALPVSGSRRWDVSVRVVPAQAARLADSVNLAGSVIQ